MCSCDSDCTLKPQITFDVIDPTAISNEFHNGKASFQLHSRQANPNMAHLDFSGKGAHPAKALGSAADPSRVCLPCRQRHMARVP